MRRFFLKLVLIVIIGVILWLGYLGWDYSSPKEIIKKEPVESNPKVTAKVITKDAASLLKLVTDFSIANYWSNATSGEVFIVNYDGKIQKTNLSDRKTVLVTDKGLKNISQLMSSPDGSKALINLTIFNSQNNQWTPLPAGTMAAVWNPSAGSGQVAYLKNDGLYIFNLKDEKSSTVLKFNNYDWQLDWLFANEIYLRSKQSAFLGSDTWLVNVKNKALSKVTSGQIKWSPNNQWGLRFNDGMIVDKNGKELVSLDSLKPGFIALAEKCFLSEKRIYCAVPKNIPSEVILPDDYLKRKIYTNDDFYLVKISMTDQAAEAKLLLKGDEFNPIDGNNLSMMNDKLLFINRYDQKLYSIDIK